MVVVTKVQFLTSSKYMYEFGSTTEISVAISVAFIIAGCTRMTYYKVYDSMYPSASSGAVKLMASLVLSPAEQLVVRMMDVGRQSNGSNYGLLAIAFAYDICSGNDPCKIKYDHRSIRQHLADCLEKCRLSHFPAQNCWCPAHPVSGASLLLPFAGGKRQ